MRLPALRLGLPAAPLLAGLLAGLLAAPPAVPAAAAEGRFAPGPCWFTPPDGEAASCGTLLVPERRDRPSSRLLRLPVAVLRSTAATPAPDPVIYIEGGPGASVFGTEEPAEERLESWWELSAPFRRTRDFVLFDQRGVGRAEPDTNCPELDALAAPEPRPAPPARRRAAEEAAIRACAQRLQAAGVDMAAFSTPAIADDVADLAAALGAPRVNLFAISYGTRVALEVLRRHGGRVRATVLDAVYPPDVNAREEEAWLSHRALKRLFDDCTGSRSCRAAFPDLEARFRRLIAKLDETPTEVAVGDPMVPLTVRLDGRAAVAAVLEAMADGESLARLPQTVDAATRGRLFRLARNAPNPWLGDPDTAEGMAFSIECRETVNAADPARIAADHRRWSWAAPATTSADDPGRRACSLWPAGAREAIERLPVASPLPVLLLSGAYDPVTPPEWGERAAFTLPTSHHMVFRAAGHVVTAGDACALDTAAAFLDTPDPAAVRACRSAQRPPRFVTQ
ncbi:MAG TPA: alpha/beta hydrolase [Azospirillum sp.]|nr:alpha/beta hydrolase [Azospirillum sp.]